MTELCPCPGFTLVVLYLGKGTMFGSSMGRRSSP